MCTFHDITETQFVEFRNPKVEDLLINQKHIGEIETENAFPKDAEILKLKIQMQKKLVPRPDRPETIGFFRKKDIPDMEVIFGYPNGYIESAYNPKSKNPK